MDDDGTVYASLGSGGVVRVRPDGQRSTLVPWWPAGQVGVAGALCRAPEGGGLLVADEARGQILLVSLEGDRQVLADLSLLAVPPRPVGLAADADRVLVVDGSMPRVLVLDRGGTTVAQWVVPTPDKGLTPQLRGITMTPQHVFVSDAANCRIVRLDPKTGAVTRAWGDRGAFPGLFENPSGLAWDGLGLLVTDTLNHRVVRFDADGTMLDQWGMHAVRPREGRGQSTSRRFRPMARTWWWRSRLSSDTQLFLQERLRGQQRAHHAAASQPGHRQPLQPRDRAGRPLAARCWSTSLRAPLRWYSTCALSLHPSTSPRWVDRASPPGLFGQVTE